MAGHQHTSFFSTSDGGTLILPNYFFILSLLRKETHILMKRWGRLPGGVIHCYFETNRSADIGHFINSDLICRLIDSSGNCSYDHEVTSVRAYRTYNAAGAFKLTILAAVNDSLSAAPPAQDFTVYYSGTLLNTLCIFSFGLFY